MDNDRPNWNNGRGEIFISQQDENEHSRQYENEYCGDGWVPRIYNKEFALKGRHQALTGAKENNQLVFMAFSALIDRVPVRYMYFDGPTLEREHVCYPHNCMDHPNEYFGMKQITLTSPEQKELEDAVSSFIENCIPGEGNFLVAELYFEALYSGGRHIVIDNVCTSQNQSTNTIYSITAKYRYVMMEFYERVEKLFLDSEAPAIR